jgi:myo-inositol-1(or 4)-monophosphatase
MNPMLNTAIKAARKAGSIIVRYSHQLDRLAVDSKGHNDFVSVVDYEAERAITDVLRHAYPEHGILAEESGERAGDEFQWVIDPLDGTTNFLHGYPQFSVSIALLHRGRLELAVVLDPLRDELFSASRGGGAHLNDRRIRVSRTARINVALLGTGFPFKSFEYLEPYLNMFRSLLVASSGVRRAGSAALDLAHVACGRLDGFWEIGLQTWDLAAGALLIEEAGGLVSDFAGGREFLHSGNIVAGTPRIHAEVLQRLQEFLPADLRG